MIQVLERLPKIPNPNVLVGFETADDAGVFRLDDQRALVQTLDFFAPVVDDPYTYGAIAAANSLSDVYAMGGTPLTALAIACFPDRPEEMGMLEQIMLGGIDKMREAGVALVGGHTVCDTEIKFGYSITGLVHPERIITNAGAIPGDVLLLTKPLGLGIITTAIKRGRASPGAERRAIQVMTALNLASAEVMKSFRCHAATDITGYGLLGHACEMAEASHVALHFRAEAIPFLEEAYPLAQDKVLPGLIAKTRRLVEPRTSIHTSIPEPLINILFDPQTSGGLLIAVHADDCHAMREGMSLRGVDACVVGSVETEGEARIAVD